MNPGNPNLRFDNSGGERPEVSAALQRNLETFGEVPVISFAWVALFILVYIVLVGPLDYLILKKVFKRLELTWITFPTIVLVLSVAAYFTAYYIKGDDRRINKVDLVEIDLHTPQAYGQTWWTIFSPRIQNYTVGVQPVFPDDRAPSSGKAPDRSVVVTVLEPPDRAMRTGSQGLFRRPYSYAEDAAGIENIPIPVWATRSFTASWRAPLPAGTAPVEADMTHSRNDPEVLTGTITNHLGVELEDVYLFYRGRAYAVGALVPEVGRRIDNLEVGSRKGLLPSTFFRNEAQQARATSPAAPSDLQNRATVNYPYLRTLLFFGHPDQSSPWYNSGWRGLDQAWRLQPMQEFLGPGQPTRNPYREEVILIGHHGALTGRAEKVTQAAGPATRLWLDHLPGTVAERPSLSGFLTQETYVRVYIPVRK
jgi:hypothetical protein